MKKFWCLIWMILASMSCQSPPASFQKLNVEAWLAAHPEADAAMAEDEVWQSPACDSRLRKVDGEIPLHLHQDREEWVLLLEGSGTFWIGPSGGGLASAGEVESMELKPGDWLLIPRRTLHGFRGRAAVMSNYSPPMPSSPDRIFAVEKWASRLPDSSESSK
ncbi:MAG: cupin domain-containing protein [Planctomycetota bacterium]|nr:MAG: cupin domain-containing protein [Planctomycetota bacterium]